MAVVLGLACGLGLGGCAECERDFECPGTRVCKSGVCEALVCRSDRDCPPTQGCARNRCRAHPATPLDTDLDAVVLQPTGQPLDAGVLSRRD